MIVNILKRLNAYLSEQIRRPYARPSLIGKVVIVTGASAGIGEATARAFAGAGSRVVLVARRAEKLQALSSELCASGAEVLVVPADITNDEAIERLAAAVVEKWGHIDIVVNNAGVARGGSLLETSPADIRLILETNLYGVIRLTQAALPHMLPGGHIVNVSSIAGEAHAPGQSVYGASKAGVDAFGTCLRRELWNRGIFVTTVLPGWTRTDMIAGMDMQALATVGMLNRWFVLDEPQTVARKILRAVVQRKTWIWMGGLGPWIGMFTNRLSTQLMDFNYRVFWNTDAIVRAMRGILR